MDGPLENDVCSICRGNFRIPCQANCSHWFCGCFLHKEKGDHFCILQVWDHGAALRPCNCPLCRRKITLLVPSESASGQRQEGSVLDNLQRIERYNRMYGETSNGLMQRMQDLPFLLKRLLRDITDPQRSLPFVLRARVYIVMLMSVFYVLSPVDIIPDGILGIIGLLDDLLIVFICFMHVAALYRAVLLSRHGGNA